MQFSTREDIEAPIESVFEMLSEFESFERQAIRRGIEVQRINEAATPNSGLGWTARFLLRGKPREMQLDLAEYEPPTGMRFDGQSGGLRGSLTVDLLRLSQRRTRLSVVVNLKPETLSARLLIQSLRLAKANLTRRFKLRVATYAQSVEDRFRKTV